MKTKILAMMFISALSMNAFAEEENVAASENQEEITTETTIEMEVPVDEQQVGEQEVQQEVKSEAVEKAQAPAEEKSWWQSWFE